MATYKSVRALQIISHDRVQRVPGILTGPNAQDFVMLSAAADRAALAGQVSILGSAPAPLAVRGLEGILGLFRDNQMVGLRDALGNDLVSFSSGASGSGKGSTGCISLLPAVDAALSPNFAIQERITVPYVGWVRIRVFFGNTSTAAANVNAVALCGSTVFHPGAADPAGTDPTKWQPVLDDSGQGGWTAASGAPLFAVPASTGKAFVLDATNDGDIQSAPSQWFDVYLPQATDAPTGYSNLFIRSQSSRIMNNWASRGYVYNIAGNYFRRGVEYANPGGTNWVGASQTSFQPMPSGGMNASIQAVMKVEIQSMKEVTNLYQTGDSIPQGQSSTAQSNNFVTQYCAANSTPDRIYLPTNLAIAGQPNISSLQHARAQLAKTLTTSGAGRTLAARAHRVFIDPYSNNDPFFHTNGGQGTGPLTRAQANASFAQAADFADFCESIGVAVTWRTKIPYGNTMTPAQEAIRVEVNQRIRNSGRRYLDCDAAVTDNGSQRGNGVAQILPAFSADWVHLNDAGHAAIFARMDADLGVL